MSQPGDKVSPSGSSIVGSLLSGESDPTVPEFQKAREDIGKGFGDFGKAFMDFFKGFAFLNNKWFWIAVLVVLLIIVGKKVLG